MNELKVNNENTFRIESNNFKHIAMKTNSSDSNNFKNNNLKLAVPKFQASKFQVSKSNQLKFIKLDKVKLDPFVLDHTNLKLIQPKFTEVKNNESNIINSKNNESKIVGSKHIHFNLRGAEIMSTNFTNPQAVCHKNISSQDITKLTDSALIDQFKNLILREKRLGDLILLNLQEINGRRLYAQLGYASLFEFLVKYFQLSESSAYQRINAMKLIQAVPEARMALASGETNLSTMAATQGFIRKMESEKQKNLTNTEKKEIFNSIKGKTQKEASATFAKINPIAALPPTKEKPLTAEHTLLQVTVDQETLRLFNELKNHLSHEIPDGDFNKILKRISKIGLQILKKKKGRSSACSSEESPTGRVADSTSNNARDYSTGRFAGNSEIFSANSSTDISADSIVIGSSNNSADSFVGNFSGRSTKNSANLSPNSSTDSSANSSADNFAVGSSKNNANNSADCFTDFIKDSSTGNFAMKTVQVLRKPDIQNPSTETHQKHRSSKQCEMNLPSRYIPATTRRRVFQRAQHRCEFIGTHGKRCESYYQLEIDHMVPWSQGGSHEESNLRCHCRIHNNFRTKETHVFWWSEQMS